MLAEIVGSLVIRNPAFSRSTKIGCECVASLFYREDDLVEHLMRSRGRTGDHVLRLVGLFQNGRAISSTRLIVWAGGRNCSLTTRQYARLLSDWLASVGLNLHLFGTRSLRRTKATVIY
jgi:hypothetical protein